MAILKQLPIAGLDDQDREDVESAANEVLSEVVEPEPERGRIRRALTILKGFLATLAAGVSEGAVDGAQEWAKAAITQLTLPSGP